MFAVENISNKIYLVLLRSSKCFCLLKKTHDFQQKDIVKSHSLYRHHIAILKFLFKKKTKNSDPMLNNRIHSGKMIIFLTTKKAK